MQTSDAYSALVKELETLGQRPARELAALAGAPAVEHSIELAGERVELELLVTWRDDAHTAVLITGHATGPGTSHHAHLQESLAVRIPPDATSPGA